MYMEGHTSHIYMNVNVYIYIHIDRNLMTHRYIHVHVSEHWFGGCVTMKLNYVSHMHKNWYST